MCITSCNTSWAISRSLLEHVEDGKQLHKKTIVEALEKRSTTDQRQTANDFKCQTANTWLQPAEPKGMNQRCIESLTLMKPAISLPAFLSRTENF